MTKPFLIFDFDSTLIQTETLDELAAIVSPHDTQIASKIAQITDLAMNGEIDFFQYIISLENATSIQVDYLEAVINYNLSQLDAQYFNF
jgi:cobalt-zinc-cadmium resistance protein CzcA